MKRRHSPPEYCPQVHKGKYAPSFHDLPVLALIHQPLLVSHNALQRGHDLQQPWRKVRTCWSSQVWTGVLNVEKPLSFLAASLFCGFFVFRAWFGYQIPGVVNPAVWKLVQIAGAVLSICRVNECAGSLSALLLHTCAPGIKGALLTTQVWQNKRLLEWLSATYQAARRKPKWCFWCLEIKSNAVQRALKLCLIWKIFYIHEKKPQTSWRKSSKPHSWALRGERQRGEIREEIRILLKITNTCNTEVLIWELILKTVKLWAFALIISFINEITRQLSGVD